MSIALSTSPQHTFALTALEAMPADLRVLFGWRRLFALVFESVMTVAPEPIRTSERSAMLLTLTTYCYAANLLASDDIEAACLNCSDIAYITGSEAILATELRQFRRSQRSLIESCLQRLFSSALEESLRWSPVRSEDLDFAPAICEFSQRRLNLAVLFDTALSE